MTRMRTRSTAAAPATVMLAVAMLTVALLAGCGGGSATTSSSGTVASGAPGAREASGTQGAPGAQRGDGKDGAATSLPGGRAGAAAPAISDQRVVRTADMTVRTGDVPAASTKVRQAAQDAKGFVADERTSTTPGDPRAEDAVRRRGYVESVFTLRVPTSALDRVMEQVASTGTVLSRTQSSEDVTTQYVDTRSRVLSQTASVARVRALLARATSLGDIVQIEGELSRRQADLESLQAQLASLENRTALSTLTVSLTPTALARPPAPTVGGFLGGLRSGWAALLASMTVLLTVIGAVLPFLVVLALIGVPILLWLRRLRARRPNAGQPQPAP